MADIEKNINEIKKKILVSCEKVGRNPDDITILGVSKTVDTDNIQKALDLGITNFGENKVQEFREKFGTICGANWHFIGHLQTNKVKYIIGKTKLIHSVESIKLAKEISRLSVKENITTDVLVEVNISGEESKYGIAPDDIYDFLDEISKLKGVFVRGLMTMAPLKAEKEEIRQIFRKLYNFFIDISQKKYNNISMDYLSMGMSGDFEIAVEEGANIVRIGSGIFA